ncbi:MAG: peptidylprolyl isomerase [Acidimicrobiia bacterium]|nr:peptidylprolyl isomerase [Acidimicrobiia bacterium]
MIPLRKFLATVALFVLIASACSSEGAVLATIGTDPDTTDITESDVGSLYESDSIPTGDTLRNALFALVARVVLIDAAAADPGVTLDPAVVEQLFEDMVAQRDAEGVDTATWLGIPDASEEMMRFNAEVAVLRDMVIKALVDDPAYLDELFANPIPITTVCVKHILVGTELEAQDIYIQLRSDADFAALAEAMSLDSAPGGDLGCRLAGVYVDDFAAAALAAPLNEYTEPVETRFGWHVLIVSERTTPTREEVIADPIAHLTSAESSGLWEDWFNVALGAAVVTIDPEIGVWSAAGIIPPTTPQE